MITQTPRRGGGRRRLPSSAAPLSSWAPPSALLPSGPGSDDDTAPDTESPARASATAAALVRWGAFSCALTLVTLLACAVSFHVALGAAAGLVFVTAACGALLHLSQHGYAQHGTGRFTAGRPGPHRGRHSRTGTGLHRGGRHWGHPGEP